MLEVLSDIQNTPRLKNRFMTAALNIDGYRADAPLIVKKDGKTYFVTRHLDRANVEELKKMDLLPDHAEPVYYKPYFGFVPIEPPAQKDFYAAIDYIARGDKKVKIHGDMAVSVCELFDERYETFLDEPAYMPLAYVYRLSRQFVEERFAFSREAAIAKAKELIAGSKDKAELEQYMDGAADSRFELLDQMMREEGIDCMFFSSPLGVQEVSGFGADHFADEEAAVLYRVGSGEILFLTAAIQNGFGEEEAVTDMRRFVRDTIGTGSVGIEELHFSRGWFEYFSLSELKWKKAQALARNFRLQRGAYNLPYYIITCRTGAYSIEGAVAWAKEQVLAGGQITELDVSRRQETLAREFCRQKGILFNIGKYWTGLHASDRSITPSYPFHHTITKASKAMKFDAGLLLKDSQGILLAASDIARSISFSDFGETLYRVLDEIIAKKMIPAVKDGMTGDEIYRMAAEHLESYRSELAPVGMIPEERVADVFNRDVGHGMSLHEPGTLWFEKGVSMAVCEGMVCAHEIQWTARGYSIGCEDDFFVAKKHGINLCRD